MLGGLAPLIVFRFFSNKATQFLSEIPVIGNFAAENLGVPIALYLDENTTGIFVIDESKSIDIEENVKGKDSKTKPIVDQKALNSIITVNMVASKDSTVLSSLWALNDMVFSRIVSKEYSISYFNGPILILNGLLHAFETSTDNDTNKVNIRLQISKANQETTQAGGVLPTLKKVIGVTPS